MGKYQARLAGDVIAGRRVRDVADQDMVPRVTFTDPQVCAVGLTEAQARERGIDVRTVEYGTGDVAGAYTLGNGVNGTSKLVVDEGRQVIVGATFTGPGSRSCSTRRPSPSSARCRSSGCGTPCRRSRR